MQICITYTLTFHHQVATNGTSDAATSEVRTVTKLELFKQGFNKTWH
jgi:hypothetical protein